MEKIHNITKIAIRKSKKNINDIINQRALFVIDKNCFYLCEISKSIIRKLEHLKCGVFLTPYFDDINFLWNETIEQIQKEKFIFNGKTRYEYENRKLS